MQPGDAPELPPSTPGPGRTRVILPWVIVGVGFGCWVAAIVLAVISVVNWFTAYRW